MSTDADLDGFRKGIRIRLRQIKEQLSDAEIHEVQVAVRQWWRAGTPIGESVPSIEVMRAGEFARNLIGYLEDARKELSPEEAESLAREIDEDLAV